MPKAGRYVVIAVGFVVAILSIAYSTSRITFTPGFAPSALKSGFSGLRQYITTLPEDPRQRNLAAIEPAVIQSIKQEPVNPRAFGTLATTALAAGKPKLALKWARIASDFTRRDSQAQFVLASEAAAGLNANIRTAFSHIDNILRVHPEIGPQVYLILSKLLGDPDGRKLLAQYVGLDRGWVTNVLLTAIKTQSGAVGVAKMFVDNFRGSNSINVNPGVSSALSDALADENEFGLLEQFAKRLDGFKGSLALSTASHSDRYGPLVWEIQSTPQSGGELLDVGSSGAPVIYLFADAGQSNFVPVLRRVLFVPPGPMQIGIKMSSNGAEADTQAKILGKCGANGPTWFDQTISFTQSTMTLDKATTIPCRAMIVELQLANSNPDSRAEITLDRFSLKPLK